jgi:hypothetical protein
MRSGNGRVCAIGLRRACNLRTGAPPNFCSWNPTKAQGKS